MTPPRKDRVSESHPPGARSFSDGELILDRFRIVRFLGRGGMGEVYEATDIHLGQVGLKTIRTDIASEESLARFRREVQLARRITHPNVCRIYDLFTVPAGNGRPALSFFTMEFLAGETLDSRIAAGGALPAAEAESVALQLCSALQAIHDAGVIHRDLKSRNVMLVPRNGATDAVITDLGLAREAVIGPDAETGITRGGAVMGTPDFMAPEQFQGETLTPAADIYSLGVIFYEMVTGSRPFHASTPLAAAVMRARQPPRPSSSARHIPRRWDVVIARCLEFDADQRFQSGEEIARALKPQAAGRRRIIACGSAAVLALAMILAATRSSLPRFRNSIGAAPIQAGTLVVLPFENIGADPANQAFTDGLQETVTSMLSQADSLKKTLLVVPSSELRRNQIKSIADARRVFGAGLALTGSVQNAEQGLQLTLNLTDARSLRQLNSRIVLVSHNEIAGLQRKLAEEMDTLLAAGPVLSAQAGGPGAMTRVPESYRLYVQGLGALQQEDWDPAAEHLTKALAADPAFTAAEAKLAEAYLGKYKKTKDSTWLAWADAAEHRALRNGETPETRLAQARIWQATGETDRAVTLYRGILKSDPSNVDVWNMLADTLKDAGRFPEAEECYRTALRLRPGYWPVYNNLGTFYLDREDYPKAEQAFKTGLSIAPDVPRLHSNLGALYFSMSRWDDAAREFRASVALKPYPLGYSNLGTVLFFQGNYAEAARQFEEAVKLQPANHINWGNLGDARWQLADHRDAARQAFDKAAQLASAQLLLNPDNARLRSNYALYLAKLGRATEAKNEILTCIAHSPKDRNVSYYAARVYTVIGDVTRALDLLRAAKSQGYDAREIQQEPDFAGLRQDPRYATLR